MKRLLAGMAALLLTLLPLSAGTAETYLSYTSTDGSYSFSYPDTWNQPTVDPENENSLWLSRNDSGVQVVLMKFPGATVSTEQPVDDVDYMLNEGDTLDEEQSGIVLHLPNCDAVQYVIYGMIDETKDVTVMYNLNLGDSMYTLMLYAYIDDPWVTYMRDFGGILGSLQAL